MSDDIDRIMTVMTAAFDPAFGEAWSRRQVEDGLIIPGTGYLLAGADGEAPQAGQAAAGFALWRSIAGEAELLMLAVAPAFRQRGIGTRLVERLLDLAGPAGIDRIFLEMREGNPAAILYRNCGFTQIGRRPNYYRRGAGKPIDAITFSLECSRKVT